MAGITDGRPELAVGEPIRLGSNDEFEIEHHPVSDRLIIRDTDNGTVAYVRKERGGDIGGDGVLIKALKEGKPMADDGRTHKTVQQAERAASSWVFVPPGTFSEAVQITTSELVLRGCGYNTLIDGESDEAINVFTEGVTLRNLSVQNNLSAGDTVNMSGAGGLVDSCYVRQSGDNCVAFRAEEGTIINSRLEDAENVPLTLNGDFCVGVGNRIRSGPKSEQGVYFNGNGVVLANNIISDSGTDAVNASGPNGIVVGNRVRNSVDDGVGIFNDDNIVANNRISGSGGLAIRDNGTGTLITGNLTGGAN